MVKIIMLFNDSVTRQCINEADYPFTKYGLVKMAFDLLSEPTDYIEFYCKVKSLWTIDGVEEVMWHDHLIGRVSIHDAVWVMGDWLKIIKDADVFDYNFENPLANNAATTSIDLSKVCYFKLPARFNF